MIPPRDQETAATDVPQPRHRSRLPGAERHRQIMEATTALIAERGYWGLSLQDVADRCGLTVPGLLHYAGSKTGLLLALLDFRDNHDARGLGAYLGLPSPAGPVEAVSLRRYCTAVMRRNAQQPQTVRFYAVLEAESLTPAHPAHDYFKARQERTLAELARLSKPHHESRDAVARQVLAAMDGIHLQWLRSPETPDLLEVWQDGAAAVLTPIGE